jgi:hypothetical protein
MKITRRSGSLVLPGLLAVVLAGIVAGQPASMNRAGLLVQFSDGSIQTGCIEFSESQISGYELLRRSGLEIVAAEGSAICSIAGEGCGAENCFCAFPPNYWSYWLGRNGWQPAPIGAGSRNVADGMLDGWVWGDGSAAPPNTAFAEICETETSQFLPIVADQ